MLLQAKGRNYSLAALLGDAALALRLDGGTFVTLYLAPKDYHRVHVGSTCRWRARSSRATYIPGKLWPVNVHAVTHVADLFAVNERIAVTIRSNGALAVMVLVGATTVGMTRSVFDGLHKTPPARATASDLRSTNCRGGRRAAGHFEFGSTVILVCSYDCGTIEALPEHYAVRMGQRIGMLAQADRAVADKTR